MIPELGHTLRTLRHARGETLEQVAESTGLSIAMLSRLERGERLPSPESINVLADHFGLPADELLGQTIANRIVDRYGADAATRGADRVLDSVGDERRMPRMPMAASSMPPPAFQQRPIEELGMTEGFSMAACSAPAPGMPGPELRDSRELVRHAIRTALHVHQRALASADRGERIAAIRSLAAMPEPLVERLRLIASRDSDPAVRRAAAEALRRLTRKR